MSQPRKTNNKRTLDIKAYGTGLTPEEIGIVRKVLAETREKLLIRLNIFVLPENGMPKLTTEKLKVLK